MGSKAMEGSEALEAVEDLETLVRLSQGAAHRLQEHVHGDLHGQAADTAQYLHDLQDQVSRLRQQVMGYVRDLQRS